MLRSYVLFWFVAGGTFVPVVLLLSYYGLPKLVFQRHARKWFYPIINYGVMLLVFSGWVALWDWLSGNALYIFAAQVCGLIFGYSMCVAVFCLNSWWRARKTGRTFL